MKKKFCSPDLNKVAARAAKSALERAVRAKIEPIVKETIVRRVRAATQKWLKDNEAELVQDVDRLVDVNIRKQRAAVVKAAAKKIRLTAAPGYRY